MARLLKKLALLVLALAGSIGLSECVFRSCAHGVYSSELAKFNDIFVQVVPDDPVQFVLTPDNKRTVKIPASDKWPEVKWSFQVNGDGFRGGPLDLEFDSDELRILILGDSYLFGSAVEDHETLPVQLEGILNTADSSRRIRVINGGVPGTNSVQHFHLLKRAFEKVKPQVVLLTYVMNDAETLHHVPKPPSYVYRHYWLWIWAEARDIIDRLTGTRFFNITKPVDTPDPLVCFEPDSYLWRESKEALRNMSEFCSAQGSAFGVFIYPAMPQPLTWDYGLLLIHESVKAWGREDGYRVVDLFPAFHGRDHLELMVPGDGHPNGKAHRIAAEEIARHLRPVLPSIK